MRDKTVLLGGLLVAAILAVAAVVAMQAGAFSGPTPTPASSSELSSPATVRPPDDETPATLPAQGRAAVPPGIAAGAAAGQLRDRVAKYIWETGGKVVVGSGGQLIVPLPERIPDGIDVAPIVIPSGPAVDKGTVSFPSFLDPREIARYEDLAAAGTEIILTKGPDGYLHIQQ